MKDKEEQVFFFTDRNELRNWLDDNHEQEESIWIKFNKKEVNALKHSHALEEALCYGWIDSQVKRIDDTFYKMKFSKRRKNSKWSEYNRKTVDKLIKSGMMTIYGLKEIDRAKETGNWITPKPKAMIINDNAIKEKLSETLGLLEKFEILSHSSKKYIVMFYNDAKREETKTKRLKKIIDHINNPKTMLQ